MVKRICQQCGKIFETYPSKIKAGRGKFHSFSCRSQSFKGQHRSPQTEFQKGKRYSKKTEFKKGHIPWLKGTKGLVKSNSGSFKKGEHRSRETEFKKGHLTWTKGLKGIHFSPNTEFKKGEMSDEKNPTWKGDKVGYGGLHTWKRKKSGKPLSCEHCGIKGKYISYIRKGKIIKRWSIDWANKSKKYLRDINDWVGLCHPCHMIYDKKSITN